MFSQEDGITQTESETDDWYSGRTLAQMRRTREQLRLACKSTAKLNKSERQVIKRFKQREAERQVIKRVKDAMQRKHKRKRIKMNAKGALLALERLALAGLVQRTSVFVEDEMLRYSTRRTRTHLPVKAAETASQLYQNMPAVPLIDKAALICCVEYMRNSKKA